MAETSPDLRGSTALVTGSTSGIGLGIAEALAAHGSDIVMNGMGSSEDIEAAIGLVESHGTQVWYHGADLRYPDQIEDMMSTAAALSGGIDTLVNSAGIQHVARLEDFSLAKWNEVLAVNLTAAFLTTQHALPGMYGRDRGRIVNIASAHGKVSSVEKAAYCAAKHALIALTEVTALEAANTNVTANAICPGWVLTPLVQRQIERRMEAEGLTAEEATAALLGDKQPTRRFATVEQIGKMSVMLADPEMDAVRGAAWSIDNNWTAQ